MGAGGAMSSASGPRRVFAVLLGATLSLGMLSAPALAQQLQAVGPPDGAAFPLDQPTTFAIQDTPDCAGDEPHPPGTFSLALLAFSTDNKVDPNGYFSSLTSNQPPPEWSRWFGNQWYWQMVDPNTAPGGQLKYVHDPRQIPYDYLPPPGTTLYWGASCLTLDHSQPPFPTLPKRRLNVVAGSRVKPPSLSELGITITDPEGNSDFTRTPQVKLAINAPEFSSGVTVSNDGGFGGGSTTLPRNPSYRGPPYDWALLSSGPERLPKTVYVRFPGDYPLCFGCLQGGPGYFYESGQTFTDDIILDQTPPNVQSAEVLGGGGSASNAGLATVAKRRSVKLRIKAKDKTSGVEEMQITGRKKKPGDLLPFEKRAKAKVKGSRLFVRVLDGAGNESRWERAQGG